MIRSALITILDARGYIHQCTDLARLDEAASKSVVTGYIGFDMTAPSLHVGSLVQIMLLRRLQQAGGKPIVLLGGGTTKVGDPTGRDESRKMLSDANIALNMASIRGVFEKFLKFGDGPTDAIIVNNDEWLSRYGYIEFLRDYGTHFTINRMLSFDSVKLRLEREQPMTFLEFNYMLMQAVDYLELSRRFKCTLQMGGSDQWGNIVNGVELCRRVDGADAFGLTTPLLATASGAKMGKTAAGAVWLNADLLSAYEYWQYWRNVEDADVGRFMKLFTDLPLDAINRHSALQGAAINDAKKALANAATALLHGEAAARAAEATAQATFDGGGSGDALPTVEAPRAEIAGLRVADALRRAGLVESNSEAKRHIKAGAVSVNNRAVSDDLAVLADSDIDGDGVVKLSVGKKRHALLRASSGGRFELYTDKAGEFRFRLKASNGQTLLASEDYKTKDSALAGIESVKRNAVLPARYVQKTQTSGKAFFVLTATNGQTIGQSEAYDTEAARDSGIAAVQVAVRGAVMDDAAS